MTIVQPRVGANRQGVTTARRRGTVRAALLASALALVASGSGCATKQRRAHPGPPRHATAVAIVTNQSEMYHGYVTPRTLDGTPIEGSGAFASIWEIELLPGEHTIEVSYHDADVFSTQNQRVTFTARAGGRYQVRAERLRSGFLSEIGRAFAATFWPIKGKWLAWVVDVDTGEVVGGRAVERSLFSTRLVQEP